MCSVFPSLPSGTDLRFAAETELAFLNFSSQTKIPVTRLCATRSGSGLLKADWGCYFKGCHCASFQGSLLELASGSHGWWQSSELAFKGQVQTEGHSCCQVRVRADPWPFLFSLLSSSAAYVPTACSLGLWLILLKPRKPQLREGQCFPRGHTAQQ